MIAFLRRHKWLGVLGVVCLFGTTFVVAAFFSALGSAPGTGTLTWKGVAQLVGFCASLGALYGSVVALDRRSEISFGDHPFWRSLLGALFGTTSVLSWTLGAPSVVWELAGAAVGGVLGWFGWRWARYVDF